jgi:hypothetical protein
VDADGTAPALFCALNAFYTEIHMKTIRAFALAAVATLASLPAFSGTYALGTLTVPSTTGIGPVFYSTTTASFTDTFTFDIAAAAGGMALTTTMNFAGVAGAGVVTLNSMQLQTSTGTVLGSGTISGSVIQGSFGTLSAGSYKIVVTGSAVGGTPAGGYSGSLGLTAVPEPGTLALFGFGLAAAGFASRRGRKTSV